VPGVTVFVLTGWQAGVISPACAHLVDVAAGAALVGLQVRLQRLAHVVPPRPSLLHRDVHPLAHRSVGGGLGPHLGGKSFGVEEGRLQGGEAAMLVLVTAGCFLIPASAGHLLLSLQDWAFLATLALLATWLLVCMRRHQEALDRHFDKGLIRINQVVADPRQRLMYRSNIARLRAAVADASQVLRVGFQPIGCLGALCGFVAIRV
jgi:hypothetical protein